MGVKRIVILVGTACGWLGVALAPVVAAEPTAHDPHYGDRAVWPAWVEKADFRKETWPPGRLLVWAASDGRANPADPACWIELRPRASGAASRGRTPAKGPDENTDVVFPGGVRVSGAKGQGRLLVRHVTVEPEAQVRLSEVDIQGNLWVRKGGSFSRAKGIFGGRDKHTFCRSDNEDVEFIPNLVVHNKRPGVSTEWIGRWKTGDEVNLFSGTFIVAPGSTFLPTDRRAMRIRPDAELVLLSASTVHTRGNCYKGNDIEVEGKLLAGTAERPLTRDCTLGLSFKALGKGGLRGADADNVGLLLFPDGVIAVRSADPERARLVFRWHRRPSESHGFDGREPPAVAAMPHGITMLLLGEARFDGVRFEDVLEGGIMMLDTGARKSWQHVAYGPGNFGEPAELFASSAGREDRVRSGGGTGRGIISDGETQ